MTKNTIQCGIYVAESSGRDKPLKGLIVKKHYGEYNCSESNYTINHLEKFDNIKIHPTEFWQGFMVRKWITKHKATMVM